MKMDFNYTNTEQELIEYATFTKINSPQFKKELNSTRNMYFFMSGAVGLWGVINMIIYFSNGDTSKISTAISMVFVSLVTLAFIFPARKIQTYFAKRSIRKEIENNKGQTHPMNVHIDSRNLSWNSEAGKGNCRLTEEIDVTETDKCYYLETRKNSLIVPKRALAEKEEQFRRMMNVESRIRKNEPSRGK